MTLVDVYRGRLGARPVPLGAYRTHPHLLLVHKGLALDSGPQDHGPGDSNVHALQPDSYVNVMETRYCEDGEVSYVRGRLETGGWITLRDVEVDYDFAFPVPMGVGILKKSSCPVSSSLCRDTSMLNVMETLPRFSFVEIVQTIYLPQERVVCGLIASGGWVKLVDCKSMKDLFMYLNVGTYLTKADSQEVGARLALDSRKVGELEQGRLVEVVEMRFIGGQGGWVRGRLSGGGWITIVNTQERKNYAKIFGQK